MCLRCGMENFTFDHQNVYRTKSKQCNECDMTEHFGKVCRPNPEQNQKRQAPKRMNWIEEEGDKTDEEDGKEQ